MESPQVGVAAAALARIAELLGNIGAQTKNKKLLYNLCLTSRAFHSAFAPYLYQEIYVYNNRGRILRSLTGNPHLRHARKLSCRRGWGSSNEDGVSHEDFNATVQVLLGHMPLLTSFEWFGCPLAAATITVLQSSCPGIKALSISYPEMEATWLRIGPGAATQADLADDNPYRVQDFTGFSQLTDLELDGMYNDLKVWRSDLVTILRASPGMQRLRLFIAEDTIGRLYHDNGWHLYKHFLQDLCSDYHAAGAGPLHLRDLHLGTGILLFDGGDLPQLTDTSYIEEVHIENKGVFREGDDCILMYDEDTISGLDFNTFTREAYPNLRSFSAYQYEEDVQYWLSAQKPSFTRQLSLSFVEQELYNTVDLLHYHDHNKNLPLPVRMLFVDIYSAEHREHSFEDTLSNLASVCSDSLEGLAIDLVVEGATELEECEVMFTYMLSQLSALRQIAINPSLTQWEMQRLETYSTSFTPEKLQERARHVACVAPGLRYVRIGSLAWHIARDRDGGVLRLEELDSREEVDVELFRTLSDYRRGVVAVSPDFGARMRAT